MKSKKSFVLSALVCTLSLFACLGVLAADGSSIEVFFRNITVVFQGKEQALTDNNGDPVAPFLYQDTVYVPLRAVSELFGEEVSWDGDSNTVLIGDFMSNVSVDTGYTPLEDFHTRQITQHPLGETEQIKWNQILPKSPQWDALLTDSALCQVIQGEAGQYFGAAAEKNTAGIDDIKLCKYDAQGTVLLEKSYGGSDFDSPYQLFYSKNLGLVLLGYTQSEDGPFAATENGLFFARFDPDTLELSWVYKPESGRHIQDACFAGADSLYFVLNRYSTQDFKENKTPDCQIMKLDREGNAVPLSKESPGMIYSLAERTDGKLLSIETQGDQTKLICRNSNGGIALETALAHQGNLTPTEYGGCIITVVRNIRTLPQPAYLSSIWFDTETVAAHYDKDLQLQWRKTYDAAKDALGTDLVLPQPDGSLIVP